MRNFIVGFATSWYLTKHRVEIIDWLNDKIAILELKRDLLKHDNPDLGE